MTHPATPALSRRQFIGRSVVTAATLALAPALRLNATDTPKKKSKIAFNTANLVARFNGYQFGSNRWNDLVRQTIAAMNETEWARICDEIAAAGYHAVEIWVAHIDPATMTGTRAKTYRRILDDCGLEPIGLGGPLTPDTIRVCQQLGIPSCNGRSGGVKIAELRRLVEESGVHYYRENHPEKSVAEMLSFVAGGGPGIGLTVDTGWLATQGLDAPATIRALPPELIRHVHIKDIRAAGAHDNCPLGEGIVDLPGTFAALREINYPGWYSWEYEPEDANPMDIAGAMRRRINEFLSVS